MDLLVAVAEITRTSAPKPDTPYMRMDTYRWKRTAASESFDTAEPKGVPEHGRDTFIIRTTLGHGRRDPHRRDPTHAFRRYRSHIVVVPRSGLHPQRARVPDTPGSSVPAHLPADGSPARRALGADRIRDAYDPALGCHGRAYPARLHNHGGRGCLGWISCIGGQEAASAQLGRQPLSH